MQARLVLLLALGLAVAAFAADEEDPVSVAPASDAEAPVSEEEAPRDGYTGRPIDGAPRFEKQAASSDRASMQWIVTKTMQRELSALGYTRIEIDSIDARRAVEVIKLKIRRPSRGMPARWRKDCATGPFGAVRACAKDIVSRVPPAILYGLLAVVSAGLAAQAIPSGGLSPRGRRPIIGFVGDDDVFVRAPNRLWLDVQIDRVEWWIKNRKRASKN
ncbi:hypothetical protein T492DRAFT_991540 [Pavlovales sp. CCMP2436]|nr:hypothetical protein T492DRAFT_991540 [Pavlovales sp. CCMP2436]